MSSSWRTARIGLVAAAAFLVAACAPLAPEATPRPTRTPAPTPTAKPSALYANCAAVKAAGKAPLRSGEPGYTRDLDGDGDGTACEN